MTINVPSAAIATGHGSRAADTNISGTEHRCKEIPEGVPALTTDSRMRELPKYEVRTSTAGCVGRTRPRAGSLGGLRGRCAPWGGPAALGAARPRRAGEKERALRERDALRGESARLLEELEGERQRAHKLAKEFEEFRVRWWSRSSEPSTGEGGGKDARSAS